MYRFTLRDVFWLMLLAGLALTWWREGINLDSEKRNLDAAVRQAESQRDSALRQLRTNESFHVADGWHTKADPEHYEMGLDHETRHGGQSSAYIKATSLQPEYYATLVQIIRADDYRGKRVRLTAFVKTENAYTFLFLHFLGSGDNASRGGGSDQMVHRSVDWQPYSVVMDVPPNANDFALGIVARNGSTWLDDLKLEVVESNVPITRIIPRGLPVTKPHLPTNFPLPAKPLNLDFED